MIFIDLWSRLHRKNFFLDQENSVFSHLLHFKYVVTMKSVVQAPKPISRHEI